MKKKTIAFDKIFVESSFNRLLPKLQSVVLNKKCFVILDRKIKTSSRPVVRYLEKHAQSICVLELNVSEDLKSFSSAHRILEWLASERAHRDSIVIAIGGGVIGDLCGFVAGIYMRGVSWINIPTTLLAQVDSCIGGKTGVNLRQGKNLVGLFHQPAVVLCNVDVLKTLPQRDLASGFGEVLKYALLFDPIFLKYLKPVLIKLFKKRKKLQSREMTEIVSRSLYWKSQIVGQDFYEKNGIRELLNFGHTLAHALEKECHYIDLRHGEAVVIGMKMALELSRIRGHIHPVEVVRLQKTLELIPVPKLEKIFSSQTKLKNILMTMSLDKKIKNNKKRFVLLQKIARPFVDAHVTEDEIGAALAAIIPQGFQVYRHKPRQTA